MSCQRSWTKFIFLSLNLFYSIASKSRKENWKCSTKDMEWCQISVSAFAFDKVCFKTAKEDGIDKYSWKHSPTLSPSPLSLSLYLLSLYLSSSLLFISLSKTQFLPHTLSLFLYLLLSFTHTQTYTQHLHPPSNSISFTLSLHSSLCFTFCHKFICSMPANQVVAECKYLTLVYVRRYANIFISSLSTLIWFSSFVRWLLGLTWWERNLPAN